MNVDKRISDSRCVNSSGFIDGFYAIFLTLFHLYTYSQIYLSKFIIEAFRQSRLIDSLWAHCVSFHLFTSKMYILKMLSAQELLFFVKRYTSCYIRSSDSDEILYYESNKIDFMRFIM